MSAKATTVIVLAPGVNQEPGRAYDLRYVEETTCDRAPVEILSVNAEKQIRVEKPQ